MNLKKLCSHPLFNYADDLKEICQPLQSLGITYFSQAHIDAHGKFSVLGLQPKYIGIYLEKMHYRYDIHMAQSDVKEQYIVWDNLELQKETQELENDFRTFSLGHTFTIMQQHGKSKDYFHFASTLGNTFINECYLSNLELLRKFVFYFKEKIAAHKELKQAYNIKLEIPNSNCGFSIANSEINTSDFDATTRLERFYLDSENYITRRELECLYWLSMGKTLDQIALILNITLRTVKAHVKNIKEKFDCNNLFQLGLLYNRLPKFDQY